MWEQNGERERDIGRRWRKWTKVWRGGGRRGAAEVGSGACRLSGVCYLWSKCTLAFLLSTPQMQLDSLLAKQTQMKWLLNDFLSNPPRQHKPSIWSLLFPSLSPRLFSLFLQTSFPHFSLWFFLSVFLCLLIWFAFPLISTLFYIFMCKSLFPAPFLLPSFLSFFPYLFFHQLSFQHQVLKKIKTTTLLM